MKHLYIFIFTFIFAFSTTFAQNIVTHFNNAKAKNEQILYSIKKIGDAYKTQDLDGNFTIPVLVDEKNGFLSFTDSGTGGGNLTVEAAIFKGTSNTYLVYKTFSTDGLGSLAITAFVVNNNYQEKNDIFPEINLSNHFSVEVGAEDIENVKSVFNFDIKLPRIGTIAKYMIDPKNAKAMCSSDLLPACKYISKVTQTEIEAIWSKEGEYFSWNN